MCPENTRQEGDVCIGVETPVCRDIAKWDGHRCVLTTTGQCDAGVVKGEDCITTTPPSCPSDTTFDGSKCISPKGPSCPNDAVPSKEGLCIVSRPPACLDGQTRLQNGQCVHDSLRCSGNQKLVDGRCESLEQPGCSDGFVFQSGKFLQTGEQRCPEGYTAQNTPNVSRPRRRAAPARQATMASPATAAPPAARTTPM